MVVIEILYEQLFYKTPVTYARLQLNISHFFNYQSPNLSLTKRSTKKRALFLRYFLMYGVGFMRLINMNRIRTEVRTFAIHDGNCVIINRYKGYAGLEGMSLYQNYANGSIRRTDALVCHA